MIKFLKLSSLIACLVLLVTVYVSKTVLGNKERVENFSVSEVVLGSNEIANDNNVEVVKTIIGHGSVDKHYNSLLDLKSDAEVIIEAEVIDGNTIVYGELPFTVSNVRVIKTLKGNIMKENVISIIETGGKYKLSGENPKDVKGMEINFVFEGIPVMSPGEHLVLFLNRFEGPQIENAFIPLGVFQGKFKVNKENQLLQMAPEDYKAKDYKPKNKDQFLDNINKLPNTK